MLYAFLPALILAMLAYMFWSAWFRMRRDRLMTARAMRRVARPLPRRRLPHR